MSSSVAAWAQTRQLISPGALPLWDTASVRTERALWEARNVPFWEPTTTSCIRGSCFSASQQPLFSSTRDFPYGGDGGSFLPRALSAALNSSPRTLINWGGESPQSPGWVSTSPKQPSKAGLDPPSRVRADRRREKEVLGSVHEEGMHIVGSDLERHRQQSSPCEHEGSLAVGFWMPLASNPRWWMSMIAVARVKLLLLRLRSSTASAPNLLTAHPVYGSLSIGSS